MKKIFLFVFVLLTVTCFGQSEKTSFPFNFGIELDGKLTKADPNTRFDTPTGVVYVGAFTELHLNNHFSGKIKAGLNNTYLHQDNFTTWRTATKDPVSYPEVTKITQTLEISLEPRLYFFSTEQSRKVNLFFALPVMFETKSFGEQEYIFRSKFMIVPSLGCRYDFTGHWGIEASGGLGWRKYRKYKYSNSMVSSEMEYGLSVGIRYSF